MAFTVYHKNNEPFFEIKEYSFSGILMDENKITATLYSSDSLNFEIGSYINFREQKYSVFNKITGTKTARTGEGIGDSMKYDLEFFSPAKILQTINFDDYVSKDDTNQYYTGTSIFHFYNNVNELAIRLQANLDRFVGDGVWNVSVDGSVVLEENQVAVSNLKIISGLDLANSVFGLSYRINGTDIIIGGEGPDIATEFSYGKSNGLYEISRTFNNQEDIVTKLKVYGGGRNLPSDYLRDEDAKGRYFTQLMLPNFAKTGIDYVEAPADMIEEYGIREGSVTFEDIFPSIEEVVYGGNRIDEIVSVDTIDLDSDYFTVYVNDLGFDINDYLTATTPVLSIKGSNADSSPSYLGGYEFEIVEVDGNKLTLLKNQADNTVLPDNVTTVRAGDRFVLLYIVMPDIYITNAENKLPIRAQEFFQTGVNDNLSYSIKIDEKFIKVNDIESELIEGNRMKITDTDLDVDDYFTIQNISIRQGSSTLPTYDVTLSNTKVNTLKDNINTVSVRQIGFDASVRSNSSLNKANSNLKTNAVKSITVWE